jgi:hypothetical protein
MKLFRKNVVFADVVRWKMLRRKKQQPAGQAEIHVWFKCPCGKRHHVRELISEFPRFYKVLYGGEHLGCGTTVTVLMPWALAAGGPIDREKWEVDFAVVKKLEEKKEAK